LKPGESGLRPAGGIATLPRMKASSRALALLVAAASIASLPVFAQDDDKEVAAALKKANEAAKKMGMKTQMGDAQKMMEDLNKKEAAHKKKQIEAAQKDLKFPAWTPAVPQFKPDGPIALQKVDNEPMVAQLGTSTATPAEIGEAWNNATKEGFSRSTGTKNHNGEITVYMTLRKNSSDPEEVVKLNAVREPGGKITKVTISKPLPEIPDDDDDD